jgi:pilus assembly protein CpaB
MFKKRGLVLVALSVIMSVAAAWVANNWIEGNVAINEEVQNTSAQVATAAIRIPYGTKVDARHIKMVNMPKESTPVSAYTAIEEVEGKVATAEILAGELLLSQRFVDHATGSTLAALVEEKKRALTIRVDDVIGVAGFLLPGNYVDVLASRMENKTRRAVTETILTKVKVLAVDQTARTEENDPVVVRAVTLEVTPKQAEILVKRKEEGSIQLTLRNPLEEMVVKAEPAPKKVVRRVRRAPKRDTEITIIRGTKVNKTKAKI